MSPGNGSRSGRIQADHGFIGVLAAVVLVTIVLVVGGVTPAAAATGVASRPWGPGGTAPEGVYRPPVAAPVVDGFRPPASPWLPGNRGLEYATVPGSLVRAIGPGRVSFAGAVAGSLYVTVVHADGLRSSYSFLAAVRVPVGARVSGGDVIGVAGSRFHLGVRRGDRYLDPASLWGRRAEGGRPILVPLDGGGSRGAGPTAAGLSPGRTAGWSRVWSWAGLVALATVDGRLAIR